MPKKPEFGTVDQLPSGAIRARYRHGRARYARTFSPALDATAWLAREKGLIDRDEWTDPATRKAARSRKTPTLSAYAAALAAAAEWAPRTAEEYAGYRRRFVDALPLGRKVLSAVSPEDVREWLTTVREQTGPTMAARVYGYVSSVFNRATDEDLIIKSPCRVRGAATARRTSKTTPATPAEVAALLDHLPEHYRALILVAAWGGLRSGEFRALRRSDVNLVAGTVHVARQVQQVRGQGKVFRATKTDAGERTVHLPPHVASALREHVAAHAQPGPDGLIFPSTVGTPISQSTMWEIWDRARRAIGRPDLRLHDLRHTAATLAAMAGATMPELRERIGHATDAAARKYLHAVAGSDARIAAALERFATEAAEPRLSVVA